jgi:hypothetical protein
MCHTDRQLDPLRKLGHPFAPANEVRSARQRQGRGATRDVFLKSIFGEISIGKTQQLRILKQKCRSFNHSASPRWLNFTIACLRQFVASFGAAFHAINGS